MIVSFTRNTLVSSIGNMIGIGSSKLRYYNLSLLVLKRYMFKSALKVTSLTSNNFPVSKHSLYLWELMKNKIQHLYLLSNSNVPILYVNNHGLASPFLNSFPNTISSKKLIVSGLKTLVSGNDKEIDLLKENSNLGIEFRKLMLIIFSKVNYHMLNPNYKSLENNIILHIEYVFGNANCLSMSKHLKDIMGEKIISYIQHFMCITFGRKTFNYEVLRKIADKYTNCTSHENQTSRVLTLMEAFVARKFNTFLKSNNVEDFEHHLINSNALPPFFEPSKSIERTQQMHCDSLLIGKSIEQYCDIKSFIGLTVLRCRVALFHNNTTTCNKLLSQLLTTMSKCIQDKDLNQKHPITNLFNEIKLIHKQNPKDRYTLILDRMGSIFFDPQYEKLKISFVLDAGNDPTFDKFYEDYLRNKIEFYSKDINLISFFPNDCSINEDTTNDVIALLEKLFPNEFVNQYYEITWI